MNRSLCCAFCLRGLLVLMTGFAPPWHARLVLPDAATLRAAGVDQRPAARLSREGDATGLAALLARTLSNACLLCPADARSPQAADPAAAREAEADGYTPLHWACCYGRAECVGETLFPSFSLPHPVAWLWRRCVLALLSAGACPNAPSSDGWTPTALAAGKGFAACLRACAQAGGAVAVADARGWTPLHRACWNGHDACAELLLALDAPAEAVTAQGWRPLHAASRFGAAGCVAALLAAGATPSPHCTGRQYGGWTPLHCAANGGHPAVVSLLLAAGAQPSALDALGCDAAHYAALSVSPQHRACGELLDRG